MRKPPVGSWPLQKNRSRLRSNNRIERTDFDRGQTRGLDKGRTFNGFVGIVGGLREEKSRIAVPHKKGNGPCRRCPLGSNPDFLLAGRTSASAECRHWSGRAVRWSSCAILLRCTMSRRLKSPTAVILSFSLLVAKRQCSKVSGSTPAP